MMWRTLALLCLTAPLATQTTPIDEVLLIERAKDAPARRHVARLLARASLEFKVESVDARDLARRLRLATGDRVNFVVAGIDRADPPAELEVDLPMTNALQVMKLLSGATDLRFVVFAGAVVIKPAEQVRERRMLRIYSVSAAIAPRIDAPGPRIGLGRIEQPIVEVDPSLTLSGFTIDTIQDQIRRHVDPDSWDDGRSTLSAGLRGRLLVRTTARNHRKVAALLTRLGVWSGRH